MLFKKFVLTLAVPLVGFFLFTPLYELAGAGRYGSVLMGLVTAASLAVVAGLAFVGELLDSTVRLLSGEVKFFSPKTKESAARVVATYKELPPETKQKLEGLAEFAVRSLLKAGSEQLVQKGHKNAAAVAEKISRL